MKPNTYCFWIASSMTLSCLAASYPLKAQIVPDATLPVNSTVAPQDNIRIIEGGTRTGSNLFHSFQEFSVPTATEAFFNNALDIQNIFSRVTGSTISNIDGLIRANGTANLFLLNPNGIIFGPNARLNIGGSFFASTASSIKFADDAEFSATNPQATSLLTISVPIGLQFYGIEGNMVVNSGNQSVTVRESGDAGQLLNTAQSINTSGELPYAISGTLSDVNDVDLYQIYLRAGQPFQATTVDGTVVDTLLFLFDGQGLGLIGNNGASVSESQSTLPLDAPFIPPAEGTYYLAITSDGNRPINEDGSMFTGFGRITPTLRDSGAELPLNGWDLDGNDSGSYILKFGSPSSNMGGLAVLPGRTLALVGGQVLLQEAALQAPGGRVEIGGLAAPGIVGLEIDSSLRFPDGGTTPRADISITNRTEMNVRAGGGGTIAINGRNVGISGNSRLLAGLASELGSPESIAGNIEINSTETLTLIDGSVLSNLVQASSLGQGGDINITATSLSVLNRSELVAKTFSEGNTGNITLNIRDTVLFDNAAARNQTEANSLGNGGNINLTTGSLTIRNEARLSTDKWGRANGGDININVQDSILLDNSGLDSSGVFSRVLGGSSGDGGNINITTGSLTALNGGLVSTTVVSGVGRGGAITINARDYVTLDGFSRIRLTGQFQGSGFYSNVQSFGNGDGGDINISTDILTLNNLAEVAADTTGPGNAGNINLNVGSLFVTRSIVNARTIGFSPMGNAGNITINAKDTIVLDGERASGVGILTDVSESSLGQGGDINITTGSLILRDGGDVLASTSAAGKAGNITITARDIVSLEGYRIGNGNNEFPTQISNIAEESATGDAGQITIETGSLSITNTAQITASTDGTGKGGDIRIIARDAIVLDGETFLPPSFGQIEEGVGIFSTTSSEGEGGNIDISTGSLFAIRGAQLQSRTEGEGDAGNVTVVARETVSLDGFSDYLSTSISSESLYSEGNGGDIQITTGSLSVTGGAQLRAFNDAMGGNAGSVTILASDRVVFDGQNENSSSGILSSVEGFSGGDGGNITIASPLLVVKNGAELVASNQGRGTAGDIVVEADSIELENGFLASDTAGGEGNIRLRSRSVQLTRGSRITTDATGGKSGGDIDIQASSLILRQNSFMTTNANGEEVTGGNITLNTDVIAALENSDISANSDNFFGGQVIINTQGIFGTQFRDELTSESDITATGGTPDQSGTVQINTPDVDPSSGLIELPQNFVDATALVDRRCEQGDQASRFVVTGRGGLPASPSETLAGEAFWEDLRLPQYSRKPEEQSNSGELRELSPKAIASTIVEAQGWVLNSKGEIILTAQVPTVTPSRPGLTPAACNVP